MEWRNGSDGSNCSRDRCGGDPERRNRGGKALQCRRWCSVIVLLADGARSELETGNGGSVAMAEQGKRGKCVRNRGIGRE